jgi:hypothetical protein
MIIAYIKDYSAMIDNKINKTSKYASGVKQSLLNTEEEALMATSLYKTDLI